MRASALLVLILMVTGAVAALAPVADAAAGPPQLDMGYGPSTLFPVKDGTPVYSAGDQLWLRSRYDSTVKVGVAPVQIFAGSNSTATAPRSGYLEPGVPARILTFNSTDVQGLWSVTWGNGTGQVLFVLNDAAQGPAGLALAGYALDGGALRLNFTSSLQIYAAEACLLGSSDASQAMVDVPHGIGTGSVGVLYEGPGLLAVDSVVPRGENYSLSIELYRSFSFLTPNSTTILVSREARVASTAAVPFSGQGSSVLQLESDLALSPGMYELRAFFQGSSGVFLATTNVLVTGAASWIWQGACESYPVYSGGFGLRAALGANPATWPRVLWLAYSVFGEEGVATVRLGINLTAVSFVGVPWGAKLANYRIAVSSATGVQETDAYNGTVYAVLDMPRAQFGYALGLGGQVFFTGTTSQLSPFAATEVDLNVSRLDVTYLVGGSGYDGGTVQVSDATGNLATSLTGPGGVASFYLPAGSYNVTATGGGTTTGSVSLVAGQSKSLVLGGSEGWAGTSALVLVAAAVLGGAANAGVWFRGRRARRSRDSVHPAKPSQK